MYAIKDLHQIELTSHCNLRCKYCPSKNLGRPKAHMSDLHFNTALEWVKKFNDQGTQDELNLAGIGESTMHPNFADMLNRARMILGWNIKILFATNGLLITEELLQKIQDAQPVIYVSAHRPEKAGPAVELLKKHGLLGGISFDPTFAATNWAGQVNWHVSIPVRRQCQWVRGGKAFMLADGRLSRCAYDATGEGVFGNIFDHLDVLKTSPWKLCETCDQEV